MTFSALYRMVWYKNYRRIIKEMIDNNDFAGAQSKLESMITEQQNNFISDHSVGISELRHMQHALRHIQDGMDENSSPETKFRLTRILEYEPEVNQD